MLLCTRSLYNDAKELAIQTHSQIMENASVFVEDAGRHRGRRAHRSRFRLEDTESLFQVKNKNIFQLMDLRLPGKRSGGVHVFHSVFQRLPQKY